MSRAMATKYSAIMGPPMVNAPAQHPEKPLHSIPAARLCFRLTRLAMNRKYSASNIRKPPNAAVRTCRSMLPSRLMTAREHTVYRAIGGRICLRSMLLRRFQAMMPDWNIQMAATTPGAMVMSKKYWAATIRITAEPKPVSGWMMPPAKAAKAMIA